METKEYIKQSERTSGQKEALTVPNAYGFIHTDAFAWELVNLMIQGIAADGLKRVIWYGETEDKVNKRFVDAKARADVLQDAFQFSMNPDRAMTQQEFGLIHCALGLMSEASEIIESVLNTYKDGKEVDYKNLKEEMGDVSWYLAEGIRQSKVSFEEVFESNINKLSARFPDKFTQECALERDLEAEEKALEA